jgi:hypothetical protein
MKAELHANEFVQHKPERSLRQWPWHDFEWHQTTVLLQNKKLAVIVRKNDRVYGRWNRMNRIAE